MSTPNPRRTSMRTARELQRIDQAHGMLDAVIALRDALAIGTPIDEAIEAVRLTARRRIEDVNAERLARQREAS